MPDEERAARIATAAKMMLQECDGEPYEVRKRFGLMVPILRGHKMTMAGLKEDETGTFNQCEVCEQVVRVLVDGTTLEGRAIENDCTAAEWRRP